MDALHQTQITNPFHRPTTLVPRKPETASPEIHLISHIDATEPIIEPMATTDIQQFEEFKSIGGANYTGDVLIDRNVMDPKTKIRHGILNTALLVAPVIGGAVAAVALPHALGVHGLASWAISAASVYAGWRGTKHLALDGFLQKGLGSIVSAVTEKNMAEPMWSGHREYEVAADSTPAFDSRLVASSPLPKEINPDDISSFMAAKMQKYPSGNTVVHMVGHGLGYRYSAGLPFPAYEKVLNDTTTKAGRAVDVVLLESCLEGNFEALAATYPYARYTVCSEETITAGTTGEILKSTAHATQGDSLTPRELASALVDNAVPNAATMLMAAMSRNGSGETTRSKLQKMAAEKGPETYIAVDNERVPALVSAVDQLGTLLTAEVSDGRTEGIRDAVKGTPKYPKPGLFAPMREKLAMGDLKAFSDRVWKVYGGGQVETPRPSIGPFRRGPKVKVYDAESHSPRAKAIIDAAQSVKTAMDAAIINKHTSDDYRDSSGISVQLPGSRLKALESTPRFNQSGMAKFDDSAAPAGWKSFVDQMSGKM